MVETSLLQLDHNLFAKAEYENPTGSVKDRAARCILEDGIARGMLHPGGTVIEATSGNMGITLAALCRQWGYACIIVMPDSMSIERQQMMARYGAEVVLTPGHLGMNGAMEQAMTLAKTIPGSFLTRQFENPANALAHFRTTGPEIWAQSGGRVDIFVAGVGTGGTITGTARFLKEKNPQVQIVAVEPAESPLLSCGRSGSHGIQGIGPNFVPAILDRTLIDRVVAVSSEAALLAARELGGVGISAGANVLAARKIAGEYPEKRVVTLLPDARDRYVSLGL